MKLNAGWVMLRAIALSAVILVGLTVLKVNPFITFVAALAPLVLYHLMYLWPRAKAGELSSVEIDSIYYYGFLLTIIALATSALTVVTRGVADSLPIVGAQFGLGLLATGYAVAARIHLLLVARSLDATDEDSVVEAYVNRSRELISSIELASSSFETYALSLQERVAAASEASQARSETMLAEAARTFAQGIAATLDEAKASVSEIRVLLNDAAFASERSELKKSVQGSVAAVTKLNVALEQLASLASTSAVAAGDLTGAFTQINERAGLMTERLDALATENGTLAFFQQRLHQGAEQVVESLGELKLVGNQLGTVSASAADLVAELSALKSAAAGTGKSLQPLAGAAERIGEIVASLEAADGALSAMQATGTATAAELERMQAAVDALLPLLEQFGEIGDRSGPTLRSVSDNVEQLELLTAALIPAAKSMSSASEVLAKHTEQIKATAAANDQLLASIGEAARTAPQLQASLSSIPNSLQRIDQSLSETSAKLSESAIALETAVSSAGASLKETAANSVGHVRQLEEGLAGVATFIIKKTHERLGK